MNLQEIIQKFNDLDFSASDLDEMFAPRGSTGFSIEGIGTFQIVQEIGGEGDGSEYFKVFYVPDHGIYLKLSGYYTSYEGTSFDGGIEQCLREVSPHQHTITIYE